MKLVAAIVAALTVTAGHHPHLTPAQLRAVVYRSHPCLAHIVDVEDGRWDPTVNYGGGHGNVNESYGLGQANPGTKMAKYGRDWRTNAWTQLRWMHAYAVSHYGSECGAWAWRRTHYSW